MKTGNEDRIRELASEAAQALGLEVEEVRLAGRGRRMLLRVFIDKPGGVTLGDCEAMSRGLEALLDVEDPIQGPYNLEVSSPGLDRPLRGRKDFEKSVGKLARVTVREKIDGQGFLIGRIVSAGDEGIALSVMGKEVEIPFENISGARLEVEIKK